MEISKERLERFKEICRTRMGVELDDNKARQQALNLINLLALTRKPIPKTKTHGPI